MIGLYSAYLYRACINPAGNLPSANYRSLDVGLVPEAHSISWSRSY